MRVATFAATYTNDVEWPASFWFTEDFDRDELMPPSLPIASEDTAASDSEETPNRA